MFRILVADSLPETVLHQYSGLKDVHIENRAGISTEQLREILSKYDGLVVRSRTKITEDLLESARRLKIIGRAGAGVDNIDTKAATRRGIIVMNTPGGNTVAATEHTIALMLAALRNIPAANFSMRQGLWDRKKYLGNELYEKTIGVVGLGKIGQGVAKRLKAFHANILGYDPLMTREMADRLGVQLVSFNELLQNSDIITLHVPKLPETLNLINRENLQRCKTGVIIVNCARGGIINEADLMEALDAGKVSMAAIDVFENEPPTNWDLPGHPKVIATPHLGASTEEAQTKVADQILKQMIEYFHKNVALNAVNFVSVDERIQPIIAPYFELADRLGILFSQVKPGRLQKVSIHFYGDIVSLPDRPIASHLMAGALKSVPGDLEDPTVEFINMVNSLAIARDKGIDIEISKKEQPPTSHTNLMIADFLTDGGAVQLGGTVYAKDIYRLVKFDQYDVDADLTHKMVIVENKDVPGIIGKVGTLLGQAEINIGHLSSGRRTDAKTAVNIFNVEGELDADLKRKLASIPNVERVRFVNIQW